MIGRKTGSTISWSDVKPQLADYDRIGLIGLMQDLYGSILSKAGASSKPGAIHKLLDGRYRELRDQRSDEIMPQLVEHLGPALIYSNPTTMTTIAGKPFWWVVTPATAPTVPCDA